MRLESRRALEALLDGPLLCQPVEAAEGKRYQITGQLVVGNLFITDGDPNGSLAMVNPGGFAQLGALEVPLVLLA